MARKTKSKKRPTKASESPKRGRPRWVVYAELASQEQLDWLDSLPLVGHKKNRSQHIRWALDAYRAGGPDKIASMLTDLKGRQADTGPTTEERAGRWLMSLKPEFREVLTAIGEALRAQW